MHTPAKRLFCGMLLCLMLAARAASADANAKVFPVRGVFWDGAEVHAIDQGFMQSLDMASLSRQVKDALAAAFAGRTGELTQKTAANTFAVSFHLTRMATYTAKKADGNIEIRTPVTGSMYFTNVLSGEILFTATSTNAALALVSPDALGGQGLRNEARKLYAASLSALIGQLCQKASAGFQPKRLDVSVTGMQNGLLLLSGGFKQGIQSGDNLDDDQSNMVRVLYAGADYAVAQPVLADDARPGSVFHKFTVGRIDGRLRPRATVLVDQVPDGFSSDYVAQLFSEELGERAPLTMVQVNRNFSTLLKSVTQEAALRTSATAQRDTPDLLIRLRVGEPILYEAISNLAFKTVRGFEANAFAEIIDTSGRVLFTASGHDFQRIEVINGLDLAPAARREIAIKNVLLALAGQMRTLAEGKLDSAPVARADADGILVATPVKVFAEKAAGYLLRGAQFQLGDKSRTLLFPLYEALAGQRSGADTRVSAILPLGRQAQPVAAGDVFEVLRLGVTPKSAVAFSLCPDTENLGSVKTPDFESIVSVALARAMPGMYYAPEIRKVADATINGGTGFRAPIKWDIPALNSCLQPVERVDITGDVCDEHCQKLVTARYTIRVRTGDAISARVGLESKFKSSGFEQSTGAPAIASLVRSDLVDEAHKLLSGVAEKIVLTPTNQEK